MSRPHLEVHATSLVVGAESIGLPTVRSIDTVFDSYFTLVDRLREDDRHLEVRKADVQALADATGLETAAVHHRLQGLLAS